MADKPKYVKEIKDFNGIYVQDNPHDLPEGGAADQVNVKSTEKGSMEVRLGVRPVSGES